MGMISAKQLQKMFSKWMQNCHEITNGDVIAIDGKATALRGTYCKDKRKAVIHMVSLLVRQTK